MNKAASKNQESSGEKYMTFFEHLEDLRHCIIRSLVSIAIGSALAGIFIKRIFLSLTRGVPELFWHTPLEPYFTFLKMAIVVGIFVAFPYVLFQMWRFVSPGLYKKEKKYLLPFIISSWVLFVLGAVFVYYVMLPLISSYLYQSGLIVSTDAPRSIEERWLSLAELIQEQHSSGAQPPSERLDQLYQEVARDIEKARHSAEEPTRVSNVWSVGRYIHLALILFLAFGLAFDLPVVVIVLTQAGLVQPKTLAKARPTILVLIFLFAAVLTPPEVITQLMMGIPMYLLFEVSLLISRILIHFKRKKTATT